MISPHVLRSYRWFVQLRPFERSERAFAVHVASQSLHSKASSPEAEEEEEAQPNGTSNWGILGTQNVYDPAIVENSQLCQRLWNRLHVSRPSADLERPAFSMILPPPNVTGSLHIGHALTCAIQDALARYHRMQGAAVTWIPGMDHAGIATQAVVERRLRDQLNMENPRKQLGQATFVRELHNWKATQISTIREQLGSLGLSLDWERQFFTLDSNHSRAVTEAFVRLHADGLIYRAKSLVSWCCYLQSAISDSEIENVNLSSATMLSVPGYSAPQQFGIMDYFAYPLADSPSTHNRHSADDSLVIVATTRLETMLADTALVVNPSDDRYKHLIGREVIHPFREGNARLPIIADADLVDVKQGTGVVKLSPGHSLIDWNIAQKHGLPVLNMLDNAGFVTQIGGEFAGLPRFVARQRVKDRLNELGLFRERKCISATSNHHTTTTLPTCSRSGDIVEPMVRQQWFVNTKQMAADAMEVVRSKRLTLDPPYHDAVWNEWLCPGNHHDWCVSRQLWWGHRIPAFRVRPHEEKDVSTLDSPTSHWVVARSIEEAAHKLNVTQDRIEQDPDVLDTWFSSALLPFSVFGWPDQTPDLSRFYPLRVMETGQDILFFWVARMVMLGHHLTGQLPFHHVILHGMIRDESGRKMSKSRGNVVDPLDLIKGLGTLSKDVAGASISSIGADALRASLLGCSLSQPCVAFDTHSALVMRRFCNKIWQTGRFALSRINSSAALVTKEPLQSTWKRFGSTYRTLPRPDRWFVAEFAQLVRLIHSTYTFSNPTEANPFGLHPGVNGLRFWWLDNLCSTHLELVKFREKGLTDSLDSFNLFLTILLSALHLLHPIMPHISEVVWQGLCLFVDSPDRSLALQTFPNPDWFAFLSDHEDLINDDSRRMSSILDNSTQIQSWFPVLQRLSTEKGIRSGLSMWCSEEHSAEDVELLRALCRLGLTTDQESGLAVIPVRPDSSWHLVIDPKVYSIEKTRQKLECLLGEQSKRLEQLISSLHKASTENQLRTVQEKIEAARERASLLERQLQSLSTEQILQT